MRKLILFASCIVVLSSCKSTRVATAKHSEALVAVSSQLSFDTEIQGKIYAEMSKKELKRLTLEGAKQAVLAKACLESKVDRVVEPVFAYVFGARNSLKKITVTGYGGIYKNFRSGNTTTGVRSDQ